MAEENTMQSEFDEYEYEMENVGEDMPGYSQSSATRGIEDEDEASPQPEDEFSRLGDSSEDPDQKRRYIEYLALIKEIECQNQVISDIKCQIKEACAKPCKTRCEIKEIKRMRNCMEQENLKLQCLMNKAMQLQNFGSHRRYHDLPIATTLDEDNMEPYISCIPPQSSNWKYPESSEEKSYEDDKEETGLQAICKALKCLKVTCPEDKKMVKEITCLLCRPQQKKKQSKKPCRPCPPPCPPCQPCPPPCPPYPCPKPCKSQKSKRQSFPPPPCSDEMSSSVVAPDSVEKLKQKICCMQSAVNKLKQEINKREKNRERERECKEREKQQQERPVCQEEIDPAMLCPSKRNTKQDQIEKLKDNYLYLLSEFAKKDCMLKELQKRMKGMCGSCGTGRNDFKDADESELELLRARVNELKEEQVEFKCIMKEQSNQLEDYRNKYLVAQQKVEEQCVTLEKLNMNNKRIEKQINTEIKEIRAKFQEKLNELLHFPKLLENEQIKLAQACKEKDELQSKLVLVCKELKALKAQDNTKDREDCRPQLAKCQYELQQAQSKIEELERQRDMFCEQLKSVQDDLDTLRSESAKIIARTKERAEQLRQQQQEQIDRLEKELAQCRATACLSVSDREAVIREMQGQLNTLSYSFDAAQKQIKTLRNHIAYVSNENCFPSPKC